MENPCKEKNKLMDGIFPKVLHSSNNYQKSAGALLNDWSDNVCHLWTMVHKELKKTPENFHILKEIDENITIGMKLKTLQEDYEMVKCSVDSDINLASAERPGLRDALEKKRDMLSRKVRVLDILYRCEASMAKMNDQLDNQVERASVASAHIRTLHDCLGELRAVLGETGASAGPDHDSFLYIEEAVRAEALRLECLLLRQLGESFAGHFSFRRLDDLVCGRSAGGGDGDASGAKLDRLEALTLSGGKSIEDFREQVGEVVDGLYAASGPHHDALGVELGRWCSSLLKHLIQPLLTSVSSFKIRDTTLEVDVQQESSSPDILEVSSALTEMLDFLDERFFSIEIGAIGKTIGQKVGDTLATPLITSYSRVVEDHFSQVETSIESYQKTIDAVLEVERSCIKCGILQSPHQLLDTYRRDADTILMESRRKACLEQARQAAHRPLHVTQPYRRISTVSVETDESPSQSKEASGEDSMDTAYTEPPFPDCEISESVVKVVNILQECLKEAYRSMKKDSTDQRWLLTARCVLDLFTNLTLQIHKKELEEVPLASGIYYNNCNYLLREIDSMTRQLLAPMYARSKRYGPSPVPNCIVTFVDLCVNIQHSGQQIWQQQASKLNQDLLESLSGANGLLKPSEAYEDCIRAVMRCLQQLSQVKNVWAEVMPQSVWQSTLSCLANNLLLQINAMIMSREDISANEALALKKIMTKLEESIPDIVQMADGSGPGVHRLVPVWSRFLELKWLLTAPLRDISTRWSGGAGVLASVMSMHEVRHMIKAVFQNTEMRSEVLYAIAYTSVPEPDADCEAAKKNPGNLAAFPDIS